MLLADSSEHVEIEMECQSVFLDVTRCVCIIRSLLSWLHRGELDIEREQLYFRLGVLLGTINFRGC